MRYYLVGELHVTHGGWVQDYLRHVTRMVEARGGRYLARTDEVDDIEGNGEASRVVVIIEWASKEAAMAFYGSDEYRPYLRARLAGCTGRLVLVPGTDANGVANIA